VALVNLFPTDEAAQRIRPKPPSVPVVDVGAGLLDAILDAEPAQAMQLAQRLEAEQGAATVLRVLAEAASRNDPTFNRSGQVLAVAGAAELVPVLSAEAVAALLAALAKSLANSQGSSDLGRRAIKAFGND